MNDGDAVREPELKAFERIEAACRKFRELWKLGQPPLIEEFLQGYNDSAGLNVFRNLLHIEIEARRRSRQNPTSEEYIQRFPQYARLIRQAFYESTMMSLAEFHSTPGGSEVPLVHTRTVSFALPAANRLGDYLLLRELGRGGFGIVYAAQHVRRHEIVALKTLPLGDQRHGLDDAERLHKFRREFRSLADINHPNLIGMQTLEVDGGQWFFTMDLVDGVDFLSYVRPDGELNEVRLRGVLPQLVAGIMALHARHIIHRDLKPSNVLVEASGKVVILDFGLVAELEQGGDQTQSLASGRFAGTPLYAAPEQMFGQRSAASDWYALGIMLYEALSGERPFVGSVVEIMQEKQNRPPPRLTGRDNLPEDVARLSDELLEREPERRPDALAIAKMLSVDASQTPTTSYVEEPGTLLVARDNCLIGRERQLEELDQAKRRLLNSRQPLALFITGRSGEGKTSLAEAFLSPLRNDRQTLILSGRCYDRELVPFKAVDSIIDALVAFLRGRKTEQVQTFIPDDILMLAQLFPVLRRVEAIGELPSSNLSSLDGKQIRDRAFAALRQMLIRISQRFPIILFIDDLHWGDGDSAAVLHRILSPPEAPSVMLLGTYRSDEADESPFVQQWEKLCQGGESALPLKEVQVGPLSQEQCLALVQARTGSDSELIRRRISELYRDTGGNPYFLEQLIDCFDPDTGLFTPAPLHEVIANRLKKLPHEATSLLEVIAVFGKAISIAEAFQVIGQSQPSFATITHMRTERLVRLLGSEEQRTVDTYHDKIRETVIEKLDLPIRQKLHRRIAESIEQSEQINFAEMAAGVEQPQAAAAVQPKLPVRVFDLAYHFDAAGESKEALVYALLAAERSKRQFALETAAEQFQLARRNLGGASSALQFRVAIGLGETLVQTSHYADADKVLRDAMRLAENPLDAGLAEAVLAESAYRHKSLMESITTFESVLTRLGVWVPRSNIGVWFAILREIAVFLWRQIAPRRWYRSHRAPDQQNELILRVLSFLPYVYFWRDCPRLIWSELISANRVGKFPASNKLVSARMTGPLLQMQQLGLSKRPNRCLGDMLENLKRENDVANQAHLLRMWGFSRFYVAEFEDGIANLKEAAHLYGSVLSDPTRLTYCRYWIACGELHLGDLLESARLSRAAFGYAVQAGQDRLAHQTLETWTRAVGGDLSFDELRTCFRADPEDHVSTLQLLAAEAHWHVHNRRTAEAVASAASAYEIAKRYWRYNPQASFVIGTLSRSLREHAETFAERDPREFRRLQRRALHVARWGVRLGPLIKTELAVVLREYSLALAALGKTKKAWKYARKACDVAQKQKARYDFAQSLLVCGQLGIKLGRPEAKQQIAEAEKLLAEFHRQMEQATNALVGSPNQRSEVSKP